MNTDSTTLRSLQFIAGAFALSITFFSGAFLTGLLTASQVTEPNQMSAILLAVLGFLPLFLSGPATKFVRSTLSKDRNSPAGPEGVYFLSKIVGLAFIESASLFGLVGSVVSHSRYPCLILASCSLLWLGRSWPSRKELEEAKYAQ